MRISQITPDAGDPVGAFLVGSAASAVWAYDLALGFLQAAVDGLRSQGRVALLVEALAQQAWAAGPGREPIAVAAAEEASRFATETGQTRWGAIARLAQATISSERGDFDRAEELIHEAQAHMFLLGITTVVGLAEFVRGRAPWPTSVTPKASSTTSAPSTRPTPPTTPSWDRGGCPTWWRPPPTAAATTSHGPISNSWNGSQRPHLARCCWQPLAMPDPWRRR